MDKIYESLGLDKLDEKKQEEIKKYITETIELKAKEMADTKIEEEKETLIQSLDERFETYKYDITSKFSNFLDDILEQEIVLPPKVMEFARKGEIYEPIIESLKVRLAIDEGVLNDEVKTILSEAKDEITKLTEKVNELTKTNIETKEDARKLSLSLYLRQKCDGLTEASRTKVLKLLEDVDSKEEIDRKFELVTNDFSLKNKEGKLDEKKVTCAECGYEGDVSDDIDTCPKCSAKLKKGAKGCKSDDEKEKGKEQVTEDFKPNEDNIMTEWARISQTGRFV